MNIDNFKTMPYNPTLDGLARITPDIVYSTATGRDITLRVLYPWQCDENADRRYPMIIFVQGSGWTFPDINHEIPQLSEYARAGYVVAIITHRSINDGYPFPAYLQDTKCAVRYMRAHADEFHGDPERVAIFGTSSGGNTALLVGLTAGDPRYETDEYSGFSDEVKAVVECFGPTDLLSMTPAMTDIGGREFVEKLLGGQFDDPATLEKAREMSPLYAVKDGEKYPPTLIIHGDCDPIVPYDNGVRMFGRLCEHGTDASMICVNGATHEGSFWSEALHKEILAFFKAKL